MKLSRYLGFANFILSALVTAAANANPEPVPVSGGEAATLLPRVCLCPENYRKRRLCPYGPRALP
jgi:hypothetical protein